MKILFLLLIVSFSGTAFAQSSARFTITRSVVAGGGATFSTSSRFQLGSTIAQPLAAAPSSAHFSVQGGFWTWNGNAIFGLAKVGNSFKFSFQTETGKSYTIQYTDSLNPVSWQPLQTLSGDNNERTVTDSAVAGAYRYYRIIEQ